MKINTLVNVNGYGNFVFVLKEIVAEYEPYEGDYVVKDVMTGEEMTVDPTTVTKLSKKEATKYVVKYMGTRVSAGNELVWNGHTVVNFWREGKCVVIVTNEIGSVEVPYREVVKNLRVVVKSTKEVF